MGFFSELWDDISGETERRNVRWRKETRAEITKTRKIVVRKAYGLWMQRNSDKINRITREEVHLNNAKNSVIDLYRDVLVRSPIIDCSDLEKVVDSARVNSNKQNKDDSVAQSLAEAINLVKVNSPSAYSVAMLGAKKMPDVKDFLEKQLKDKINPLLLNKIIKGANNDYPYEHSTTMYVAEFDPFIGVVNDFVTKELKNKKKLESEWNDFNKEIMEIRV